MRVPSRFSGMFTRGELVYAGSDAEAAHDPGRRQFNRRGGSSPLIDDDAVRKLLYELASEIGGILEQEKVHVGYRDQLCPRTESRPKIATLLTRYSRSGGGAGRAQELPSDRRGASGSLTGSHSALTVPQAHR